MDTNKMRDISREQFEYHFLVELAHEECDFHIDGDRYVCQATEDRWYAWQASREAVVIDLSKAMIPGGGYFEDQDTIAAIEAQGLKVAP